MAKRKRKVRVIEALRKSHPGEWTYDREMNEWKRADGMRVYSRAHISISENGCESYYSRWYVDHEGRIEPMIVSPRSDLWGRL